MIPRERKTPVQDFRIPAGYTVILHEGVEIPDRYEAREGQRKLADFDYKDDAVQACIEDNKKRGWAKSRYDIIAAEDEDAPKKKKKGCSKCDKTVNDADGTKVQWMCNVCDSLVCRDCTLTIPGSMPIEYFHETLCSHACWEKAGRPEE